MPPTGCLACWPCDALSYCWLLLLMALRRHRHSLSKTTICCLHSNLTLVQTHTRMIIPVKHRYTLVFTEYYKCLSLSVSSVYVMLSSLLRGRSNATAVETFQSYIVHYLSTINLSDFDVLCCQNTACDTCEHKVQIDVLYSHLTNCLTHATLNCFSHPHSNSGKRKVLPGWNDYVIDACLLYTSPSPRDRQKSRMPSSA